jgi:hypothetical protein
MKGTDRPTGSHPMPRSARSAVHATPVAREATTNFFLLGFASAS